MLDHSLRLIAKAAKRELLLTTLYIFVEQIALITITTIVCTIYQKKNSCSFCQENAEAERVVEKKNCAKIA